ncbi:hypothetical protein [Coraliomargarita parva]|uniref:hypothetical protein n=1 Tax=Coraliomargarita parva TaxID=3014050 RepID=UPI0022B4788D|nr:hypothetical protein [Coraliomargarita parva]
MKVKLLYFVACLWMFQVSSAQEPEPVRISFAAFSLGKSIGDLAYESGQDVEHLDVPSSCRSELKTYTGGPTIVFFTETAGEEGQVLRKPVARVAVPASGKRYLFVFIEDHKDGYKVMPLSDDIEDFGAGTYRFVNFADYPVAIELGEQREMIKPKGITDIKGKLESDQYYDTLMISLPEAEKPRKAFKGQIYFSAEQRMLYFVYQKPNSRPGTIKLIGISEMLQSEAQAE